MPINNAESVIVLDFETTGLSPSQGDRAIEIGAVRIENGVITDSFQELMNPGVRVSGFIEIYTGIKNSMLINAAPCNAVMRRFYDFIGKLEMPDHRRLHRKCLFSTQSVLCTIFNSVALS